MAHDTKPLFVTLWSRSSRLVLAVSISSSRRAVPQAAQLGEGSPGEMAFSRRFAFGLVTFFRMKVACSMGHTVEWCASGALSAVHTALKAMVLQRVCLKAGPTGFRQKSRAQPPPAPTLELSGFPARIFMASTTMRPLTVAFVVAMACMMLPAIPCRA